MNAFENDDIQSCNGCFLHLASYPSFFSQKEELIPSTRLFFTSKRDVCCLALPPLCQLVQSTVKVSLHFCIDLLGRRMPLFIDQLTVVFINEPQVYTQLSTEECEGIVANSSDKHGPQTHTGTHAKIILYSAPNSVWSLQYCDLKWINERSVCLYCTSLGGKGGRGKFTKLLIYINAVNF